MAYSCDLPKIEKLQCTGKGAIKAPKNFSGGLAVGG